MVSREQLRLVREQLDVVRPFSREQLEIIKQGVPTWNAWREANPTICPDFDGADFRELDLREVNLSGASLRKADLSGARLDGASFYRADVSEANLNGAKLYGANLSEANLSAASLNAASLERADLSGATLFGASLFRTYLWETDLRKADLRLTNLVEASLTDVDLTGCRVYGVSVWRPDMERVKQQDLVITAVGEPEITVDSIEVAQFLYLLLHNEKIRHVIDTITSKAVLILGRFSLSERKVVLDALRYELRKRDLLPIIFDFSIPVRRDVTETVKVLAGLARFVIADITDATEVRVELHTIVRDFPSLPVQPILLRGRGEFVSMENLKNFPWLLPTFEYDGLEHLLANLGKSVVGRAEAKVRKLRRPQSG
ncbi:MAG TPA: pentapeptide repeat-containing protein [Stellaceae bacterium]|jgi:hypothetical protein|nr:pentapeptide repeat-containing protein [Stellaceae bacterium]